MGVENARVVVPAADAVRGGLLELSLDLLCAVDADGALRYVNGALARALGAAPTELLGSPFVAHVAPADREGAGRCLARARQEPGPVAWEGRTAGPAGEASVAWRAALQPETALVLVAGRDVTEVRTSGKELRANQRLLRAVFDTIPHSLVAKDRESNLLMGNAVWSRRFGYWPEELLGRNTMEIETRPEADRVSAVTLDRLVLEGDRDLVESEFERTSLEGTRRCYHNWRSRLRDDAGQVIGLVSMSEDITERGQSRQALLDSERRFRNLIEGSIQGIVILRGRQPVFANQSYARIFGYERAEEITALESVDGLVAPHDRQRLADYGHGRMRGEPAPTQYEFEGVRRDGSRIWLECLVRTVPWDGSPAIQCALLDITERKRAEERLRANDRLLQTVFDTLPQMLFVKDTDSNYLMANAAWRDSYGYSPEDIVGRHTLELEHRPLPDREDAVVRDRAALQAGRPVVVEYDRTLADGTRHHYRNHRTPLRDEAGAVVGIVGIAEDVTEQKRAEDAARSSQRLLRMVVDALPHSIFVKDLEGRFAMANRAMATSHGLTPEQVVGRRLEELPGPTPEERAVLSRTDQETLAAGGVREWPEMGLTTAGGDTRIHRLQKMLLHGADGQVQGLVCVSEDITERRRAEDAARSSQRLLRLVVDALPHNIHVKDRSGRFVMANRAMSEFHQVALEQMVGLRIADLPSLQPEECAALEATDRQVLETGCLLDLPDVPLTDASGRVTHQHLHKLPLRNDAGQIDGVVGISVDVSERRRAEQELRDSQRLLQAVLDVIPMWVFVKDRERRMLMVNRRLAADHDMTPEEAVWGRPLFISPAMSPEQIAATEALDRRVLESGQPVEVASFPSTLTRGQTRNYRTIRMPLRDDQGQVVGIVGISEDVTERERTQRAVQQAQKLESLGVLAGGIAHDFNNLLVSVLGYAQLASTELPPDSPVQPLVQQIETAGRRAGDLCTQMLAYAGKGSFRVSRVQLNELIQEMTELIRVPLSRNIRLQFDFDPSLPELEVDATQLRQVVMNLVINASEAIAERPGAITVRTGVREVDAAMLGQFVADPHLPPGPYVYLEVADTGSGMDAETLQRIFDPFFTTKFSGRGLGLAAVLGIVRGHQGALRVASTPGAGTTFTVLLPLGEPAPEATQAPAAATVTRGGSGAVLVADDEAAIRELVRRVLENRGFDVTAVSGGEAVLQAVPGLGPALRAVILDATMPGLATADILARLRDGGVRAPVIVMSGHAESDVRERTNGLPVAGFLTKPFTGAEICAQLEAVLGAAEDAP